MPKVSGIQVEKLPGMERLSFAPIPILYMRTTACSYPMGASVLGAEQKPALSVTKFL